MAIGLTDDQRSLAASLAAWVADSAMAEQVRSAGDPGLQPFGDTWDQLSQLGVMAIALPESVGGAGGTMVDLACALEACARGLVPGPLLSTAVAGMLLAEQAGEPAAKRLLPGVADGAVTIGLAPELADLAISEDGTRLSGRVPVVWDAGTTTHLLVGTGSAAQQHWFLLDVEAFGVDVQGERAVDLSRNIGTVELDGVPVGGDERLKLELGRVREVAVTLAAAEAAGIAGWALDTAVEYAKVREQFGRQIGSFQSIKHLCAQMLELSESATAVAWDAASAYSDSDDMREQFGFSAVVAGAVGLDAAVSNAKECIQVLGGIGFTWEHDAHLYLRRAISTRQLLGGADGWRLRAADQALAGRRRKVRIDVGGQRERAWARERVAAIAELPSAERRVALAEAGLIAPHWPKPYGLGAGAVEQLVVDEELDAAGITRPELGIGSWAAPTLLTHGSEEQQKRFVAGTLRGEITWCQLFSEPGAGSDLASLRTRAERVEGGWRLSGQKVWTSLATEVGWAICLARTNSEAPKHKGITYFLVDMSSEGIDIGPCAS